MKFTASFSVWLVSVLLVVYNVLLLAGKLKTIAGIIFFLSPILIAWMAYRIIRYDVYHGNELEDGEEWGYADKNRHELNMF